MQNQIAANIRKRAACLRAAQLITAAAQDGANTARYSDSMAAAYSVLRAAWWGEKDDSYSLLHGCLLDIQQAEHTPEHMSVAQDTAQILRDYASHYRADTILRAVSLALIGAIAALLVAAIIA